MIDSRRKGRAGECIAKNLLADRDWNVIQTKAGLQHEDMVAVSPEGKTYSVEVKHTRNLQIPYYKAQAMRQAKNRKLPWMLMMRIFGYSSWIIIKQGESPIIWQEKGVANVAE